MPASPDPLLNALIAAGAAVLTAAVAFGGVLISNRGNNTRLRMQLEHDLALKKMERMATFKRDAFVKVAGEIAAANAFLGNLAKFDPSSGALMDKLLPFTSALAQTQLVADSKTTLALSAFGARCGEIVVAMMRELPPLTHARSQASIADELYNKERQKVDVLLAEMTAMGDRGESDSPIAQRLKTRFEFHQEQAAKYAEIRGAAQLAEIRLMRPFNVALLRHLRELAPMHLQLIAMLREELGLSSDLDALKAQAERGQEAMAKQLEALYAQMRADGFPIPEDTAAS